jgi:hypothetical protein
VIGELLPFAIVVTVSPINIVAAFLLLFSKKPVLDASCYLAGFLVGVATVLGIFTAIASAANIDSESQRSTVASWHLLALRV